MPVKEQMTRMAYSRVETFFNEQVLRAVVLLGTKELYGEFEYARMLEMEKINGFSLTEFTVEQLNYYGRTESNILTLFNLSLSCWRSTNSIRKNCSA